MKSVYKFIAGNSYVTPIGVAAAAILATALHRSLGSASAPLYLILLIVTLVISTMEPVQ